LHASEFSGSKTNQRSHKKLVRSEEKNERSNEEKIFRNEEEKKPKKLVPEKAKYAILNL
jgi:hypothetical protein